MRSYPALFCIVLSCATPPAPVPVDDEPPGAPLSPLESHFTELKQLTFGGENAEAYWSFDGRELIYQATVGDAQCDRIYRLSLDSKTPVQVSSGKGATTCAYFLPGNDEVVFASTHLGGDACPPKPDRSQGYAWALYDTYDIFKAKRDGSELVRLTDTPGYDAEATVCPKDGSIVFTSVRDGDLELYRMDRDGKNVKRLTFTPGYDGGAFFNHDCTKIVWRASRPQGRELDDYRSLLSRGLVRPSKLELYVANADGSDPTQITALGAASFAPFFHPSGRRILFSSNFGDPKGREFEIYAVDVDGTNLERITYSNGFDGFPMFSPDGTKLVFASNRATAEGKHDTNVFLATWVDDAPNRQLIETAADRIAADVRWLAHPDRQGRGVGTEGLAKAGEYLEQRMKALGLEPAGDDGTFRQHFPVATSVRMAASTKVSFDGQALAAGDFTALGFSAAGTVKGPMVLAGYGLRDDELSLDDYAKLDVKGKVVVVRRFTPEDGKLADTKPQRRLSDLRHKAWTARERGAKALVVVDWPAPPDEKPADWKMPADSALPSLLPEGTDVGIPVVVVKRAAMEKLMPKLESKKKVTAELTVQLEVETQQAFNVVGVIRSGKPGPGVVLGAHYDHLGFGGRHSLAPDKHVPHVGADDNASGTAAVLEAARALVEKKDQLAGDVVVALFSAEESGVLGSTHFTRVHGDAGLNRKYAAMLNLDMVGRLRANRLTVIGGESAEEWPSVVNAACARARVECSLGGDGYGPSDQTPFYAAGLPVLHFFTGAHSDYHKPSDTPDRLNYSGAAQVAKVVADVAEQIANGAKLTFRKAPSPTPRGDLRSFNASLGTIPDYAGPPQGLKGVLLAGVRPGGAADLAGLKRGDVLIRIGKHDITSVEDLMYVLNASKPGETVTVVVVRDGKEVSAEATLQESRRR